MEKVWICYTDENAKDIEGYFDLIDLTVGYVKIASNENIITIPLHRVLKIKQSMKGGKI